MRKSAVILFALATAAWCQTGHQHHPPRSAAEYAKVLNDPKREAWQKPDDVVRALGIGKSEVIADIGAGTGYFARRFAPVAARVYAVDIDQALLKLAAEGAPANLEIVLASTDDPKLPANSVDLVFFCDVLHHIGNRPAYLKKLARALRPGGRLVNIDFYKKELPVGPPPSMKLSEQEVIAEMKAAGFTRTRSFDFLPYQYFLVFNR
ncbi:MAG: class I SAM-dependent methyltransferase [Acidobacteria bacterium]|nr:class I SAM-dependent methyltransferase [Acidobacteriota bacterium]